MWNISKEVDVRIMAQTYLCTVDKYFIFTKRYNNGYVDNQCAPQILRLHAYFDIIVNGQIIIMFVNKKNLNLNCTFIKITINMFNST